VVAYGHHPLAVIAHPDTRPWAQAAPRRIPAAPLPGGGGAHFGQGAPQARRPQGAARQAQLTSRARPGRAPAAHVQTAQPAALPRSSQLRDEHVPHMRVCSTTQMRACELVAAPRRLRRGAAATAVRQHPPASPRHGLRAAQAGVATVQDVLQRHGAQAYLAGHLHGVFGQRLHRMHPGADGGAPAPRPRRRCACTPASTAVRPGRAPGCAIARGSAAYDGAERGAVWRRVRLDVEVLLKAQLDNHPTLNLPQPSLRHRPPGGAGGDRVEGRPALPAALAGRRRPGLCGPSVPHGLAAAAGRRAGRRRARRRRQLLRLGRAMRLAHACCRAMRRGPAGFPGPQCWGTGVDVAHHQEAHVRLRLVGRPCR